MQVLVVEDDRALGLFLKRGLELEGHQVGWVEDGEAALASVETQHPDLVLLDLSLPKRDGMEVLTEMRARRDEAAVLVLSGRSSLNDRVQCLEGGADDYLSKPFSYFELRARCRALLRRRRQVADPVLRFEDIELHRMERRVVRGGRTIDLTTKEYALLEYFLLHHGECVSRSKLLAEVWQIPTDPGTNVVDVYVNYLRRKLGRDGSHDRGLIETVRGTGYRMGGAAMDACVGRPSGRQVVASALIAARA